MKFNQKREFDRQIKEAKNAAKYALTLDEKLDYIQRVRTLEKQRLEFRKQEILNGFSSENTQPSESNYARQTHLFFEQIRKRLFC